MTDRVKVTFESAEDGARARHTESARGASVLDAAHAAGVEIVATCGARGRCRSCRIKLVEGVLPPPTVQDTVQLGHDAVREGFRLACQTRLTDDCVVMAVPPRSEAGHQILGSERKLGDDAAFALDSGVVKQVVDATPPRSEHHQSSDHEEMLAALNRQVSREVPLDVLRKLPQVLRKERGRITVTSFQDRVLDVEPGDTSGEAYGMAFDIGTTSIVGNLLDLATGEELAAVGGMNPQAPFGGDLMSRIAFAQFDPKKLQTLRAKALNALNDFIKQACAEAGVSPGHVYKIVVVGNTCMHHVLLGIDVSHVGLAPYAPVVRDALVLPARDLPLKAAPQAVVCTLPIVAGFVGADTMACVLATRIYDSEEIRGLVDIGTNGEVVMGNRDRLMACSAPAGPAFEGAQIRHGMRGAVGAIERVEIGADVDCTVIGGQAASGICGSGLLDACAKMIDAGVMDRSGLFRRKAYDVLPPAVARRFLKDAHGMEFVLVWEDASAKSENVTLTQGDIRQLQLAKSAIYSGVAMLQQVMDVSNDVLEELMLCGGFGNYIDIESALKIRLLPELPPERVSYVGNAAALGAQMALLSESERQRAEELAARIEHVALAARPDFQDVFIEGMKFAGEPPARAPEPAPPWWESEMRIDLLFGFLGSGKTTLARRILEEWGPRQRLALIVNEFGDVGVDGAILEGYDIDLVELSSGCLCCTLKGSLLNAIEELAARAVLDHIVIEATGVAEPEEMIATFADPSFREAYELGPITTVVDAAKFARIKFALGPFFTSQIEKADFLVLNKVDLADGETLENTRREVRAANPQAVVRFADHGDIDIAEIMQGPPSAVARRYQPGPARGHDAHGHDHHEHRHAPADSFVLDAAAPVERSALERFFAEAPEGLWRAKGFLRVDGTPALVQFAMGELEVSEAEPRERDYLVLIGHDIDRGELAARFGALSLAGETA